MLIVPTQALPNQTLQVTLDGQQVALNIYQTNFGLFCDIILAGTAIVTGQIAQNLNLLVNDAYLGFQGDFCFFDTLGTGTDPIYTGLGDQYQLIYLEASDLATLGLAA